MGNQGSSLRKEGRSVPKSVCVCEPGVKSGACQFTGATCCVGTPVPAIKVSDGVCATT